MATVKMVLTELANPGEGKAYIASWPLMLNGDVGEPIALHEYSDRSVQVEGTIGAGGNCRIEGSNNAKADGTSGNWRALNDPSSTALNFTSLGAIKGILEAVYQARPEITAGDGSTSITVTMFLRKTAR